MAQQSAAMRALAPWRALVRRMGQFTYRWARIAMILALALGPNAPPPPLPPPRKIEARAEDGEREQP